VAVALDPLFRGRELQQGDFFFREKCAKSDLRGQVPSVAFLNGKSNLIVFDMTGALDAAAQKASGARQET
jgi:hypothetical protein